MWIHEFSHPYTQTRIYTWNQWTIPVDNNYKIIISKFKHIHKIHGNRSASTLNLSSTIKSTQTHSTTISNWFKIRTVVLTKINSKSTFNLFILMRRYYANKARRPSNELLSKDFALDDISRLHKQHTAHRTHICLSGWCVHLQHRRAHTINKLLRPFVR